MQTLNEEQKIKISVAVVFYNPTRDELLQTRHNIESLLSLDSFHFSFYLIDNGSSTQKIEQKVFDKVKNVVNFVELKNNYGFGKGHNAVLDKLDSKYHVLMNPDITINDLEGFKAAIGYLDKHQDIVLLSPLVRDKETGNIQYLNRKEPTVLDLFIRFLGPRFFYKRQQRFTKQLDGYDHIQTEENATGSFMILRTSAFKELRGFDPRFFMYFEDTDLTVRLSKIGKVIIYPQFTVYHGWRRANHSLKGMMPMIQSMIKYFNKWGWRWY